MTLTGLLVIPLGFLLILLPWRYSFPALLVFSTLNSAAVVNVGSFGLQPGYFFAFLMIGRTAVEVLLFRHGLNRRVVIEMLPLFGFLVISITSLWLGLTFFQGRLMVIGGTDGFNLDLAHPFNLRRENFTQLVYLIINISLVYALAHQLVRLPLYLLRHVADRGLVLSILFSSAIVVWEMANFYGGVYFPANFFHSNAGYYSAYGQSLGDILRVSGPFSEPSALAYFFTGYLFFAWHRYLERPGAGSVSLLILCLVVLALSTATTAYISMVIFTLVMAKDFLLAIKSGVEGRLRPARGHMIALVIFSVAVVGVMSWAERNWRDIDTVVTSTILEKRYSSSFAQRTGADMMAIDIAMGTGGIGIGLGSHKPNNLVTTLLSNTGLAGLVVFCGFLFAVLRPRRDLGTKSSLQAGELAPFRWLVMGFLIVHAISNPNLNPIILWISFALVIGLIVAAEAHPSMRRDGRAIRPDQPVLLAPTSISATHPC